MEHIIITKFSLRQFDKASPSYINYDCAKFMQLVNQHYNQTSKLVNGYAPFCKHIFMPNFTEEKPTSIEITKENQQYIQSDYIARRSEELPVLTRWIPRNKIPLVKAKCIDVILYDKEQIDKESKATGIEETTVQNYSYGIVGIKFQDEEIETPMLPITMMRNSLDIKYGGSGVEFSNDKYNESIKFWKTHVSIC